jgi:tRNA-specific adenosine deaminase 1
MLKLGNAVTKCVHDAFRLLPAKAKPRSYPDGSREWVPLSGFVLSRPRTSKDVTCKDEDSVEEVLTCVSLG